MPIQGNIEEAGLPDVLQLLSLGRKSGCLTLIDGDQQGHIYLDVGRISYATVANRLDRLGDMLVKNGRITQEQLTAAVEEQERSNKRQLGRILVDSGQIDRAELESFIRLQVEQAVYYLFTWKQGTFSFASDRLPPHQPLLVSLDAEALLLEGARRVDEWSLIQRKIPSFDLVYRSTRDKLGSSADGLTDEQKRILPLVDGSHDVAAIIDDTAMSEFEVGKALYGLVTAGLIQLVERRARIRHLEYRDLLAYVVREAEFADPQRRKEAARHIVDCPTCAERLRTIHVRKSSGTAISADEAGAIVAAARTTPVPQPATASAAPEARTPSPLPRTVAEVPAVVAQLDGERRTGRERRAVDRRTGIERRQSMQLAAQSGIDQRKGPRRDDDRRVGPPRERKSVDAVPRPAAAAAAGSSDALPGARKEASPVPAGTDSERADLNWLVTPRESLDMIRSGQGPLRVPGVPSGATGTGASAAPAARSAGDQRAPALTPVPTDGAAARTESRRIERFRGGSGEQAANGGKGAAPAAPRQAFPLRSLAVAAVIACVALIGYMAGQLGRQGETARTGESTEASGLVPTAAQAQSPTGGRSAETGGGERTAAPAVEPPPQAAAPAAQPVTQPPAHPAPAARATTPPVAHVAAPAPTPRKVETAAPAPAPTVGIIRGIVHDAAGGTVAGARVSVRGTALSVVADGSGAFEIRDVPDGQVAVQVSADGYVAGSAQVRATAGAAVASDLTLARVPVKPPPAPVVTATASEPDRELAAGGWAPIDRAEATSLLGGTLGAIQGLSIESLAKSTAGSRTRVRLSQVTQSGERIVLTETRAGAAVRGTSGPAVVTALRVMPASEAYQWSTGTASFGNILVTVKTTLSADVLRPLLQKLVEVPGE